MLLKQKLFIKDKPKIFPQIFRVKYRIPNVTEV